MAFANQPVIVCETFLVGKDISIQTFPTWHPKPVSGCRQERFCLGLRRTASRASEVSRLVHCSERSTISSGETASSRLLWVRLSWFVLWRLVLREGADIEPRERGQVASTFSPLSSSSLRAEGGNKRPDGVHFFECVSECGPVSK